MVDISAFDAAFAEASKSEDALPPSDQVSNVALKTAPAVQGKVPGPNPTPPSEAPAAPEEPKRPPGEAPEQAEESELEVPAEGEPEKTPEPAAKPEPTNDQDMLARFAAMMAAAQPQTQQPRTQPENRGPPPVYDQAELQQLQTFYQEWPDVAKAAEVMARGMVVNAMRSMYADMAGTLAPYLQMVNAMADQNQLQELTTKVPDYDVVADQLISWVDVQPAYLQPAYRHVIEQGTSTEVVDLIERFKRDTGAVGQSQQQAQQGAGGRTQPTVPARNPTELSSAAKQAAAKLAPISSKRANASTAAPVDFDAAFAEFAKTI
jgi:hypothetical protein